MALYGVDGTTMRVPDSKENRDCNEWLWCSVSSPGAIPKHLRQLRDDVKRLILPNRRARTAPREVKVKMSNYAKKRSRFK